MAKTQSVFSQAELDYLHGQRLLGRIATVGADGTPHVAPVGPPCQHELRHSTAINH